MTTLQEAVELARGENGLAVVSTLRADSTIQSSLVNAGVFPHPSTGEPVLAFVTYGRVKVANLRARPQLSVTFRSGGQWAAVEGRAELAGLDAPQPWLDVEELPALLRNVFTATGGRHSDLGGVRPGDGRAAADAGPDRTDKGLQQLSRIGV